jgi:uncharacterized membrane protein YdjX (TVP38/TMEM64 family)
MNDKRKRNDRLVMWAGLATMAVMGILMMEYYEVMEAWVVQAGIWGPLLSVGLYMLLSLTPVPSDPLTVFNVVLFGWNKGLLISWMGNNAAAMTEYAAALSIRNLAHFERYKEKLPNWLQQLPVDSIWFLLLGRFVPGIGGKAVSIMAGLHQVSLIRYGWTAAAANLVGTVVYMLAGLGLLSLYRLH